MGDTLNLSKKVSLLQKLGGITLITLYLQGCGSIKEDTSDIRIDKAPTTWSSRFTQSQIYAKELTPQATQLKMQLPASIQQLVHEALAHNQDLKAAAARLDVLQATQKATESKLWPDARLNLGANKSETRLPTPSNLTSLSTSYSAGISASWEVDIWGRLKNASDAAESDIAAQAFILDYARQSLVADVVLTWLDVMEAQQLLKLAQKNLSLQQQRLSQLERRMDQGLVNPLDVRLTRNNVASLQNRLLQQDAIYHNALRRLEVLLGRYPKAAPIELVDLPQLPNFKPAFAPKDLLNHRPDLLAAEKKLISEKLRVQETKKRLLPQLNLTSTYSNRTNQSAELFDFDNWLDSFSAPLLAPLFEPGRLRADIERQKANADLAIAQYRQATLKAWLEVESFLYGEKILLAREDALTVAWQEAEAAEVLTQRQYEQGLATSFEFLTAQNRRINAEDNYIQAKIARVANRIGLHLSMGISIE